jgi:mono/diheme cytochrome c family protein
MPWSSARARASSRAEGASIRRRAALAAAVAWCTACGSSEPLAPRLSDAAERGRATFVWACGACHNAQNPFADGITGPPVARASRELLEARIMRAEYPAGHRPKRDTQQMPAQPHLRERLDDLTAFLAEVPEPKPAH